MMLTASVFDWQSAKDHTHRSLRACEHGNVRESGPLFEGSLSGCAAFVPVVEPAEFGQLHHSPEFGRLNSARNRCILFQ
jgi:hypothetical protein